MLGSGGTTPGSGQGCWGQLGGMGTAQAAGPTGLEGAGTLHQAGLGGGGGPVPPITSLSPRPHGGPRLAWPQTDSSSKG